MATTRKFCASAFNYFLRVKPSDSEVKSEQGTPEGQQLQNGSKSEPNRVIFDHLFYNFSNKILKNFLKKKSNLFIYSSFFFEVSVNRLHGCKGREKLRKIVENSTKNLSYRQKWVHCMKRLDAISVRSVCQNIHEKSQITINFLNNNFSTVEYSCVHKAHITRKPWCQQVRIFYNCTNNKCRVILLLRSGDVERNPGPVAESKKNNDKIIIMTLNVNGGLNNPTKQKLFLNKIRSFRNGIIGAQETHLTGKDEFALKARWGHQIVMSHGSTAKAGVSLFYKESDWDEVVESGADSNGRMCYLVVRKTDRIMAFVNIYSPNTSKESVIFWETTSDIILTIKEKYAGIEIIVLGDLNVTLNSADSINRIGYQGENMVRDIIKTTMETFELFDSRQTIDNNEPMPSWNRGRTYSRLDYILIPETMQNMVTSYKHDWKMVDSDHCSILAEIGLPRSVPIGRGYYKINTSILEDLDNVNIIKEHIELSINNIPEGWNPHQIWDYIKMEIRSICIRLSRIISRNDKLELELTEKELQTVKEYLIRLENEGDDIDQIEEARESLNILKDKINVIRDKEAKRLLFNSKVRYAEQGEKNTKYFMSMIKEKQKKSIIEKISINNQQYQSTEMITKISEFYKDLYKKRDLVKDTKYLETVANRITEEDASSVDAPINIEEAKSVLNNCKDSCPGIDSIPYSIYKTFWSILGRHLVSSWNWSIQTGTLSSEQKHSVITLLQKPGKPIGQINNLRPISLSNCDIKIMTKTLTNRITKLGYLFSKTQTAYIKGRNITDNTNHIQNIIEYCNEEGIEAYIISLDASKAFDSIDHEFMFNVISKMGFGNGFINIIRMLYNNLTAEIMVNGVRGPAFNIERGVKQGDALSCVLFILCMEVLLCNIDNNHNIVPVQIPDPFSNKITKSKTTIFADDLTPIVKNKSSIKEVFKEYDKFSCRSGIFLNKDKTEILKIGHQENNSIENVEIDNSGNVVMTKDKVKICGIYFGNNKEDTYSLNVTDKINKLQGILNNLKRRYLTLEGNILVVKTLALSQIVYTMQNCIIQNKDLKRVESMIYNFIWRGRDKIKREIMKQQRISGGLLAPDVEKMNLMFKLKLFHRLTYGGIDHPVRLSWGNRLWKAGFKYHGEFKLIDIKALRKNLDNRTNNMVDICISAYRYANSFIVKTLEEAIDSKYQVSSEYKVRIASATLDSFVNQQSKSNLQNLIKKNIVTIADLMMKKNDPELMLEKLSVIRQIPNTFINLINNHIEKYYNESKRYRHDRICIGVNCWLRVDRIKSVDLNCYFTYPKININNIIRKIGIDQNEITDELAANIPLMLSKTSKEVRLRDFQYKLTMNILSTRSKLYKYKHVESEFCLVCEKNQVHEKDNTLHSFYSCYAAQNSWKNFRLFCKGDLGFDFEISKVNCLIGIPERGNNIKLINELGIILKKLLHCPISERRIIDLKTIEKVMREKIQLNKILDRTNRVKQSNLAK